jgi:hypothetical protein
MIYYIGVLIKIFSISYKMYMRILLQMFKCQYISTYILQSWVGRCALHQEPSFLCNLLEMHMAKRIWGFRKKKESSYFQRICFFLYILYPYCSLSSLEHLRLWGGRRCTRVLPPPLPSCPMVASMYLDESFDATVMRLSSSHLDTVARARCNGGILRATVTCIPRFFSPRLRRAYTSLNSY